MSHLDCIRHNHLLGGPSYLVIQVPLVPERTGVLASNEESGLPQEHILAARGSRQPFTSLTLAAGSTERLGSPLLSAWWRGIVGDGDKAFLRELLRWRPAVCSLTPPPGCTITIARSVGWRCRLVQQAGNLNSSFVDRHGRHDGGWLGIAELNRMYVPDCFRLNPWVVHCFSILSIHDVHLCSDTG